MSGPFFDEMHNPDGSLRELYRQIQEWIDENPPDFIEMKRREAEFLYRRTGITFAVYSEGGSTERIIPFDIIPRLIDANEWDLLRRGLTQRAQALNAFLADVYSDQRILKERIVDPALILLNSAYEPEMQGVKVPGDVYTHIAGIDIVRVGPEEFYVLEDNARTPSGVSYMLENREMMMRLFPDLFTRYAVAPVDRYPEELLATLASVAPPRISGEPTTVLLTPGRYNSAYYEHSFLADMMGIELVEGQDLFVSDTVVYMRTTEGPKRVDVIYRRVDDAFIDPLTFNPDSMLGVPGLMTAYRAGNVVLANAVGAGIADDKSVYTHVPDMIRFYLDQEPILKNVPTYKCSEADDLAYTLEHLEELVVKEVHGSGGYGMLVGPKATKEEREKFAEKLKAMPDQFIAQPTLALSTVPTYVNEGIAPRHVDLRPFILCGSEITIVPGGLTRVALKEGSLVVNSSQGGGTKDTWVITGEQARYA